jgi:hypothetical protein
VRGCSVGTCGGSALTTEPPPLCPPRRALDQRQGSASAPRLLGKIHALLQAAATSELQSNRGAFAKLIRSRHSSPTSKLAKLTHLPSKSRNSVRSSHQHRIRRPNAHPLLCISLQFANPTLPCMLALTLQHHRMILLELQACRRDPGPLGIMRVGIRMPLLRESGVCIPFPTIPLLPPPTSSPIA